MSGGLNPSGPRPKIPSIRFMPGNYDESEENGLPVAGVTEGGPAQKGGLRAGDVIIAVAGKPVKNIGSYMTAMAGERAGKPVKITVQRKATKVELTVVPE